MAKIEPVSLTDFSINKDEDQMDYSNEELKLLECSLIFAILMQNDEGIENKSPDYILEKIRSVTQVPYPNSLLDRQNKVLFKKWCESWRVTFYD